MDTIILGLSIPFLGTLLGSATVFLLKDKMSSRLQKMLLGFASGVMIAASVWSLLIPAIEVSEEKFSLPWFPPAVGFLAGMAFLLALDSIIPHLHLNSDKPEGVKSKLNRSTMLTFAVTLHNIPEGMAVGVVLAGVLSQQVPMSLLGALALSIGIGIQNFPEGAIISMPLRSEGMSKFKAFMHGALSGIVEPLAAIFTIVLIDLAMPIFPYLFAFSAGAMIYVVVEELIPESQSGEHSNIGTIGVALGFVLMMILDVAL
jgi:ZIP family zinc transporter